MLHPAKPKDLLTSRSAYKLRSTLYRIPTLPTRPDKPTKNIWGSGQNLGGTRWHFQPPRKGRTLRVRFVFLLDTKSIIMIISKHHKSAGDRKSWHSFEFQPTQFLGNCHVNVQRKRGIIPKVRVHAHRNRLHISLTSMGSHRSRSCISQMAFARQDGKWRRTPR